MSNGESALQISLAMAAGFGLATIWYKIKSQDLRRAGGSKKICGFASGAFRGGDFVMNTDGVASTCSFCFKVRSKAYGLTVGHLASVIGDPVYAFVGEGLLVERLGVVVSHSVITDSLIFSITEDIPIA
jgi:hypothetical protein